MEKDLSITELKYETIYKLKVGKMWYAAVFDGDNFHFFGSGNANRDKKLPLGWYVKAEPGLKLKNERNEVFTLAG